MHRANTFEQLGAVDFAVVHEHVRVRVGRSGEVALPDAGTDLGPAHALLVEQADPAVAEIVRAEHWHAAVSACAANRHPQAVSRTDRKERRLEVAVLTGWRSRHQRLEEVIWQLDPPRPPRLRNLGAHHPRLARLVQVTDRCRRDLPNACARRIEHEQTDQIGGREQPGGRLDVVRVWRFDLVGL